MVVRKWFWCSFWGINLWFLPRCFFLIRNFPFWGGVWFLLSREVLSESESYVTTFLDCKLSQECRRYILEICNIFRICKSFHHESSNRVFCSSLVEVFPGFLGGHPFLFFQVLVGQSQVVIL